MTQRSNNLYLQATSCDFSRHTFTLKRIHVSSLLSSISSGARETKKEQIFAWSKTKRAECSSTEDHHNGGDNDKNKHSLSARLLGTPLQTRAKTKGHSPEKNPTSLKVWVDPREEGVSPPRRRDRCWVPTSLKRHKLHPPEPPVSRINQQLSVRLGQNQNNQEE